MSHKLSREIMRELEDNLPQWALDQINELYRSYEKICEENEILKQINWMLQHKLSELMDNGSSTYQGIGFKQQENPYHYPEIYSQSRKRNRPSSHLIYPTRPYYPLWMVDPASLPERDYRNLKLRPDREGEIYNPGTIHDVLDYFMDQPEGRRGRRRATSEVDSRQQESGERGNVDMPR